MFRGIFLSCGEQRNQWIDGYRCMKSKLFFFAGAIFVPESSVSEWVKWPVEIDAVFRRMGGLLSVGKCDTVFRHTFRFSPCLISQHHMRGGICSHKHTDRHTPAF